MYQKVTIFVITSIRCGRCIEYERFSSFMSRLLSSSSSLCQVAAAVIEYESNQRFTFNYLEMHQFYNEVVIIIMIVVVMMMLIMIMMMTIVEHSSAHKRDNVHDVPDINTSSIIIPKTRRTPARE